MPHSNLHQLHLSYLLADPHQPANNLQNLFAAFQSLPSELTQSICLAVDQAIRTAAHSELESDQTPSLSEIEARASELVEHGLAESFLCFAIVSYVANDLRFRGDLSFAAYKVQYLETAIEVYKECAAVGIADPEEANSKIDAAQRVIDNSSTDAQSGLNSYEAFCNEVIRKILPANATQTV